MAYNLQKQYIYSIQVEVNQSGLIEIETIILNGLYRFSILGIKQRKSTDTRDRVYSALRSQKLINLKSDNKKITVNLLPANIEKNANIYDLGIALSCLSYMGRIEFTDKVLTIGELSILGNILGTGFLLKSIHQAIKNNIKTIICPQYDLDILYSTNNDLYKLLESKDIKIISAESLDELIENIKNKKYHVFKNTTLIQPQLNENNKQVKIFDNNLLKIVLSLCTKRNIFIENKKGSYVKKFINNLIYYNQKLNSEELLTIADKLNVCDSDILELYTYSKVSVLDNQTQKNELLNMLNESIFGFNIIENFLNMNEESMYIIKKNHVSSIVCFYDTCPCGNSNNFFNNINNEKCYCLQRNIVKYKQGILKAENDFFDLHINNIETYQVDYQTDDYLAINNIISIFRNTNHILEEGELERAFIQKNINLSERSYLDKVIDLAKDICKLDHIVYKKDLCLNLENIKLATDLLKKDF